MANSKYYPSISLEKLRKTEKKLRMANTNLQCLNEGHFTDKIFRAVKIFLVVFWFMTLEELAVSIFILFSTPGIYRLHCVVVLKTVI